MEFIIGPFAFILFLVLLVVFFGEGRSWKDRKRSVLILQLLDEAYPDGLTAADMQERFENDLGSIGSIWFQLEELHNQGFIRAEKEEPTPPNPHRRARWSITSAGHKVLDATDERLLTDLKACRMVNADEL